MQPDCGPVPLGNLPVIDAGALYDSVGEETYYQLLNRERQIMDWAVKNYRILEAICEEADDG